MKMKTARQKEVKGARTERMSNVNIWMACRAGQELYCSFHHCAQKLMKTRSKIGEMLAA